MPEEPGVFFDRADLWALQLWRSKGLSTRPLAEHPWWQEWQAIRAWLAARARDPAGESA